MKKGILISLLLLLTLSSVMIHFIFLAEKQLHYWAMMEKVREEKNLVVFELTKDEFEKAKVKANEISINGEMFDIKKTEFSEGKITVSAIRDKDEEKLIHRFAQLINATHNSDSQLPQIIGKILQSIFIQPHFDFQFSPHENFSKQLALSSTQKYFSPFLTLFSPPPEL